MTPHESLEMCRRNVFFNNSSVVARCRANAITVRIWAKSDIGKTLSESAKQNFVSRNSKKGAWYFFHFQERKTQKSSKTEFSLTSYLEPSSTQQSNKVKFFLDQFFMIYKMNRVVFNKKDEDGKLLWPEVRTNGGDRETLPCEYTVGYVPKYVE